MGKAIRVVLGVHAHWAGSQWASIDNVLERALERALHTARAHGAAVALDFDARGLEELAARAPAVLARLRRALADGRIELTGASFGQPCAQLHGGESNLRQRIAGVRVLRRLLDQHPRAIWEGAASAHPQLPQVLRALGAGCVGLVPAFEEFGVEVPEEEGAGVLWRGLDGSSIPAIGATALSRALEDGDFESALGQALESPGEALVLAWVPEDEARAEELLRRLASVRSDPRFEYRPAAFSELAAALGDAAAAPVREYAGDEFFHGSAPGKNGDMLVRGVAWCEEQLLAAESLASLLGRLGESEPEFSAWPAWEFEESWRELFVAQHHAISAREARLAAVAECSIERSLALAQEIHERSLSYLGRSVQGLEGGHLVLNPLGWARDVLHDSGVARAVPAFGYKVVDPYDLDLAPLGRVRVRENADRIALVRGRMRVEVDRRRGVIEQISTREFPEGLLDPARPLLALSLVRGGRAETFPEAEVSTSPNEEDEETDELTIRRTGRGGASLTIQVAIEPLFDAVWIRLQSDDLPTPDAGARAGLSFELAPRLEGELRLRADHPYGIREVGPARDRDRRAFVGAGPAQPVDRLERPFTALRFVDLSSQDLRRGVLYVHDGSPAFSRAEHGVSHLLSTVDPLDEGSFEAALMTDLWIVPHAGMGDSQRMRRAMECTLGNPRFQQSAEIRGGGALPSSMGALQISPEHVLVTAFWREPPSSREHLARPLADGRDALFAVRLVEFDGRPARARLQVAGKVSQAARTDLLGEVQEELEVRPCAAVFGPADEPWSEIAVELGAHAIATIQFV